MILYEGRKIEGNTHNNIYSSEVNSRQKPQGIFSSGQQYNQSGQQGRSQTSHNSVRANKRMQNQRITSPYHPIIGATTTSGVNTNQPSSPTQVSQQIGKFNYKDVQSSVGQDQFSLNRSSNEELGYRISSTGNSRYRSKIGGNPIVPPLFKPNTTHDDDPELMQELRELSKERINLQEVNVSQPTSYYTRQQPKFIQARSG
jgi:hypothetical protein